ncbi:MAG: heparinase II/III-family protein [Lachnospiraceae bacterium]|nr:heparinase II/III-family protein [Lachnospiraceae bacterium]
MFHELAQTCRLSPDRLAIYPSASIRDAWEGLDEDWKNGTLELGKSYLDYIYPQLSAKDYLDYFYTGNRVRFEEKYFARRRALDALVLAECVADTGEFLNDIINGIFCICEESGWQLPPHNTYIRDTPPLPLPDSGDPVLDLFACETGSILATVSYLLGDKLDGFSPLIQERIRRELEARVFRPYLERHFWWMGNGKDPLNNWTIWCTQNVLLCAFLADIDDTLRRRILVKACQSVDYYLMDFGEDGCCVEGAAYYRCSGLCLFNVLEILNGVTGNHFLSLYQEPKIQNIASYIMNVHIQDKYYANFADCSPVAGRCGAREFLFACRTGNKNMAALAAKDFAAGISETMLLSQENNLYYRLQNAFSIKDILSAAAEANSGPVSYPDIYYPSAGLFIARDDVYFLAVKAGCNGESHGHNDTGSFIVYKNGSPLLIDVGVESYTKKTFSPQRYEIWTMQSAYHNLPTVCGCMQKDGNAYGAADVQTCFSGSCCEIQMDIAPAYPPESNLLHYIRKAVLVKGEGIRFHDSFCLQDNLPGSPSDSHVVLSFMTYERPVLEPQQDALLFHIGDKGSLHISGGSFLRKETIPITDQRLSVAWEHEIYRILIWALDDEIDIRIS